MAYSWKINIAGQLTLRPSTGWTWEELASAITARIDDGDEHMVIDVRGQTPRAQGFMTFARAATATSRGHRVLLTDDQVVQGQYVAFCETHRTCDCFTVIYSRALAAIE